MLIIGIGPGYFLYCVSHTVYVAGGDPRETRSEGRNAQFAVDEPLASNPKRNYRDKQRILKCEVDFV
jgi:hypothetical protein